MNEGLSESLKKIYFMLLVLIALRLKLLLARYLLSENVNNEQG